MAHASSSHEQLAAEPLILAGVSNHLGGVELKPRSLRVENGARVDLDGVAEDESVLVGVLPTRARCEAARSTRSRGTRSS
jgi:hypothetical protein